MATSHEIQVMIKLFKGIVWETPWPMLGFTLTNLLPQDRFLMLIRKICHL